MGKPSDRSLRSDTCQPAQEPAALDFRWKGPYGWPHLRRTDGLPRLDETPCSKGGGVYLETVEYDAGGYILLSAGITKRPFPKRFAEHRRHFLNGEYNMLDLRCLRAGVRKELWHGWQEARKPERRLEFARRKDELRAIAWEQMKVRRIFVAEVEGRGLQSRIEGAVFVALYRATRFQDIPDKGVHIEPRYASESPIIARNHCDQLLHSLPSQFEI